MDARARGDLLRELAPLLAEDGIDLDHLDVPDPQTLQAAMTRAVDRLNMTRFTPVGRARELAVAALRQAVEALTDDDTNAATAVLERVQPESPGPRPSPAASAGPWSARRLACRHRTQHTRAHRPPGRPPRRSLAGRACRERDPRPRPQRACLPSLDTLIVTHGGENVLYGSVLTLAAVVRTWAADTDTSVAEILLNHVR